MNRLTTTALAVAFGLGLTACQDAPEDKAAAPAAPAATSEAPVPTVTEVKPVAPKVLTSGIDKGNFDEHIRHQDDFFLSVNGSWLARTEIPADRSNYGSFTELFEKSETMLKTIMEDAALQSSTPGSDVQKLADFWKAYMDSERVENVGMAALQAQFDAIENAKTHEQIAALMGQLLVDGVSGPFGFYVNNDAKQSDQYAVYLYQAGISMPDRDYYLNEDEKFVKLRESLRLLAADLQAQSGVAQPEAAADSVLAIETAIASAQWSRVESRDANKTYNKMNLAELAALMPGFDWPAYAKAAGLGDVDSVIVRQPSYMTGFAELFAKTPVAAWKAYMRHQLVSAYSDYLPQSVSDRAFAFYGTELKGVTEQKPRWKKAVIAADEQIGDLLGKAYVAEAFKPEAKARMEHLITNLLGAFEVSIKDLAWMTEETKVKALEKLSKFSPKIGYPEKWKDYATLEVKADDLLGNYRRAANWEYQRMLAKLGQPIDDTEWHMTPQTVNAYYNPVMNEIVFPAAILQPPFFDMDADDAVNYASIGAVIGHEISHGFDDQGSKYDGDGNLSNWWTDADRAAFDKLGKQLVAQYSQYEPLPGHFVNGELTLGENIGDLSGLQVAYKAYQMSLAGADAEVIDELTADQRFFMGWSQIWRRKYREEELLSRLKSDPHSPSHYRVIGIVSNMPQYYEAFNVAETDQMYIAPEKRVKIW
ncbi:M13 family peptidase [Corallincola luteus]|uniref:M13 family peptidase n=1 Tax=Corallincola luteus TaxID=1775177 RepID=A0ABY2ALL6_9GAMM|nr:M13 family metallopeptidase [Corallincola luteus]TCI03611.1 M13 family peptidase [Corallincola luteus]